MNSRIRACERIQVCLPRHIFLPAGVAMQALFAILFHAAAAIPSSIQPEGGHEVMRERMPKCDGLGFDQAPDGKIIQTAILGLGVGEFDALASFSSFPQLLGLPFSPASP
jgi:hypothetical protein